MRAAALLGLSQQEAEVLRRNATWGVDEGRPEPLPTPAELGHRLRGHRTGPPRLRAGGPRAARLFEHQRKTGQVPHIVFNPGAPPESYLRGPVHWVSAGLFPDARPYTSALCQPPTMLSGGSGSGRSPRGWREDDAWPSARDLPGAPEVAPLPGDGARPGGLGARDHLPPVGERHGQLPPLGRAALAHRGRGRPHLHPLRRSARRGSLAPPDGRGVRALPVAAGVAQAGALRGG